MQAAGATSAIRLDWPERFRGAFGRAPRILHIGNIGNYAWTNATMMRRRGIDCAVLDPDNYHVVSAPEWVEADLEGDPGDPFHPRWSAMRVTGFRRPEWLINGPTPFVLRELAAREQGQAAAREAYALMSRLYRRGLASPAERHSLFRRVMESRGPAAVAAKALARRLAVGGRSDGAAEPKRAVDELVPERAVPAGMPRDILEQALGRFDIVIGYALGARFPMASGHPRFASLEIGTLRGLVFEPTPLGALAADIYRRSPIVFVTNVDVLGEAARLGIDEQRIVPIPHPFDAEHAGTVQPIRSDRGPPVFFAPARHHWRRGSASWVKGNDILIEGAALFARGGADFQLRFVRWGEDVAASAELIAKRGLAERTEWISPLPRRRLWPEIQAAVAVVDQFSASAFGGVALEAMALGKRVISRLDQADLAPFFGSRPPLMSARTPEEVCRQMQKVLEDADDRAGIGAQGRRWMRDEHGSEQQLGRQFAAFESLIAAHGPARARTST